MFDSLYTVHGILRARILERVAIPFSSRYSQPRDQTHVSHTAGGFLTTTPSGRSSALNSFLLHFFCSDSSPYIVSLYGVHWLSIFLSFSFGSLIWMLSTNLPSNTLILFSFSFPWSSLLLSLCVEFFSLLIVLCMLSRLSHV